MAISVVTSHGPESRYTCIKALPVWERMGRTFWLWVATMGYVEALGSFYHFSMTYTSEPKYLEPAIFRSGSYFP